MVELEGSQVSSPPSLQELCGKVALEQILRSDQPDSDFASLDSRSQVLLFTRLRTKYARLRMRDRRWRRLAYFCPRTDLDIYLSPARIEPVGDDDDEQDRYNQQRSFLDQWSYFTPDDYDSESKDQDDPECDEANAPKLVDGIRWHNLNLVSKLPKTDLKLCFHNWCLNPCPCRPKGSELFSGRVSSQLLLYRLNVIFGMPPPREHDTYKCCWVADLRNRDGVSVLSLQDFKGGADARFHGTPEASVDALKLLNFLIGMECLHTYDGVVAGTRA